MSFGVLAQPVMGSVAPIVMSVVVFAGAAQFAALSVLAAGGGPAAAITAGHAAERALAADGLRHRALAARRAAGAAPRRARRSSTPRSCIASRGDGSFDRGLLMGATAAQGAAWVSGTVIGVLAGPVLGDPSSLGPRRDLRRPSTSRCWSRRPAAGRAIVAGLAGAAIALRPHAVHAARRADHRRVLRGAGRPAEQRVTTAWIVVAALSVGTAIMRAAGPVAFGGRSLSGRGAAVVGLVAPALLGALVVYETVSAGGQRRRARRPPRRPRRRRRWRSSCACP